MSKRDPQLLSLVSSKELANSGGLTLSTVHYYTTIGLLQVRRRVGNKRFYDPAEARSQLQEIARLRQKGYSLALVRQILEKKAKEV